MSSNGTIKKWYAIYTKPRWEKKVYGLLLEKGVECYCPLNKVHRKWSDRIKVVEEPLFKSYVFVRVTEDDKTPVRMVDGVVNFVYWEGKPAIIKDKEILTIRKFLSDFEDVEVRQINLAAEDTVVIQQGVLMGKKGTVKRVLRKKVEVLIESIGFTLTAYIDKSKIGVIEKQ
ncbi:UpxY family transcription antiterminator [Paraflavitalea sp. CAU 1676]|uniref:UpxY family transcription antiterminator n=1 Tax=Paraflavitalea sp. CAU 1676 TaxID=3032598 RepID=UPI0023DB9D6B|nr:UpxY family transcription antiterminator [Paraflavitalea sp. CAU 1676]MDF2187050.1 UpxY family transcription antiterminator [Paraflavitalea sp. CAU 1676]